MNKVLVFDMDGTIADFYGVKGWFEDLQASNPRPYVIAEPLVNMEMLISTLELLKCFGWEIVITSWLAKGSTKTFDDEVRKAKKDWLEKMCFPYDEIHLVKYGTTKANCTRKKGGYQVLIDDNEQVRKGWSLGNTIDANTDIIRKLDEILIKELKKGLDN